MVVVNCVCSAQLRSNDDDDGRTLKDLFLFADKVYNHRRPTMALFKRSGSTIMVFTSMKCRIMGFPTTITAANNQTTTNLLDQLIDSQKSILTSWSLEKAIRLNVENFTLTTTTMTHKLPKQINFYHHEECLHFDLEIFCGAKFLFDGSSSSHVNVFSSGQVVITGVKSQHEFDKIVHLLYEKLVYK